MAASSSSMFFGSSGEELSQMNQQQHSIGGPSSAMAPSAAAPPAQRKRRNQPGTPNPDAEVIALSPQTLMATNRFLCEVCNKGFQREQNLQLHRRGHNLPWKLRQKTNKEVRRKVYLCPEPTCVHHDPSRALGDLTGIKKHFSRKHGEKKFKCDKCSKKYAVQSDWKAHSKTCGTREYKCDCGTLFSRRDSFVTHRAFCDALAQESVRQVPPVFSSIGTHLYGNTSSSTMSLGFSSQLVGPQFSQDQSHITQPSRGILGLGGAARTGPTFGNLFGQSTGSAFRPTHAPSAMPFFMPPESNDPEIHEETKQVHGTMILGQATQYPDQSHSSGGSLFNLSFLSGNGGIDGGINTNSSSSMPAFSHHLFADGHANMTVGDNSTNLFPVMNDTPLYTTSLPSSQLSATALLQKAAMLGSTSSSGSASVLKSFGNSSSSGGNYHELMGHLTAGGPSSIFGIESESINYGTGFNGQLDQNQVHNHQNFGGVNVGGGGSERVLTRDFLGVGEIVRGISGGGASMMAEQQRQHGAVEMSSMDSEETTGPKSQMPFGGGH